MQNKKENSHNLTPQQIEEIIINENKATQKPKFNLPELYEFDDIHEILGMKIHNDYLTHLQTIDDLLERDKQREKDGFPRRIRIGKYVKPTQGNQHIVIVPTTTEPKFYHDDRISEDEDAGGEGGTGEEQEGEVIGEQPAETEGEGEGSGAGQGKDASHEIETRAFDLGKVLTEKFSLPNLKEKGKKRSFNKYTYDLTDRHRGFGQLLDKKETLKRVIKTNILLENISEDQDFSNENDKEQDMLINPHDHIYRILSPEKDIENQAVVFFIRDYSGSMQGKPTEAIAMQHLFIYSWLVYQYQIGTVDSNNPVTARFILHDTEAKEVPDFYTYHSSQVAGGTNIFPAYQLVNKIIDDEHLLTDNNIYIFHGTDGDDWEEDGKQFESELKILLTKVNRFGVTVAKNSWGSGTFTIIEKNLQNSGLLVEKPDLIRLDSFPAEEASEGRIIQGIKHLIG